MKIAVLGCGWLGLPLAKKLVEMGYVVKGSVTSRDKLNQLSQDGITPYIIKLFPEGVQGDLTSFLQDVDKLVVNIPPGLRKDPESNFVGTIGRLASYVEKSSVKQVIFVSSTGVFEDTEDFNDYTESSAPNNKSERGKQLIGAEHAIQNENSYSSTILRFGGLIGPGRHPVNYLSNKNDISDPDGPVNLINAEDCMGIIIELLESDSVIPIIHGVNPYHPGKKEYYTAVAEKRNLAVPGFQNSVSKGKIIKSEIIPDFLDYEYTMDIRE